jgi:predicted acyltransferase
LNKRFYSLDIFRGATVAFMILVNNPGDWSHIFSPLEHAPWHGCTPTDLVFPFFLFAVGNAMAFVFFKIQSTVASPFLKKVFIRALLIFVIGLFLNWFPFVKWDGGQLVFKYWVSPSEPANGIRILGVLQRIALCYLFASLIIYYFKIRGAVIWSLILLLGYWALCILFGDHAEPFSLNGYFGLPVDKAVLGVAHMYKGEGVPFDPEGLASTLPAIAQVIFGYLVSNYILQKGKTHEMLAYLFTIGCMLLFAGYCWDMLFPLNKKIWSSSFVVYTSGMATLVLCVLMYLVEFRNMRGAWCKFFEAFGKNPLFIFVLSGLVPRLLGLIRWNMLTDPAGKLYYDSPLPWFYQHVCMPVSSNLKIGSLLYAVITVCFYWLISYWLDRKKIYIRV